MAAVAPARDWLTFSDSLLELLDEIENCDSENDAELHKLRLEQAISSLCLIFPIVPVDLESSQAVQQLLRNLRIMLIGSDESHSDPRNCTALAVYNLEPPNARRSGSVGRPKLEIPEETLLEFRSLGFSWKQIAGMLLVSRWTLRRRVKALNIEDICGYSNLSDDELDQIIRQFVQQHGKFVGYPIVSGHLKSLNIRIQRRRIRESLARIDPGSVRLRWAVVVSRRSYSVPGPNSLWHIDGHHSLISFVIHGAIDGFSRYIVYLHCSTNNRSETVAGLFEIATVNFGYPSRVKTDKGGENVLVWAMMEEWRGSNRGSYLAGSSTHNQRIERLWRDLFCMVCNTFYYTFQAMEESGVLNISNVLHKFVLHFVFTPRINKALLSFVSAWNNHPIRTERNWSPTQIWSNGMIDMRNQNRNCTDDPANFSDDLDWYGYDGSAPRPSDDGLSTVEVEDLDHDFPDDVVEQLKNTVDPCQDSNDFGMDIYLRALDVMLALTG